MLVGVRSWERCGLGAVLPRPLIEGSQLLPQIQFWATYNNEWAASVGPACISACLFSASEAVSGHPIIALAAAAQMRRSPFC